MTAGGLYPFCHGGGHGPDTGSCAGKPSPRPRWSPVSKGDSLSGMGSRGGRPANRRTSIRGLATRSMRGLSAPVRHGIPHPRFTCQRRFPFVSVLRVSAKTPFGLGFLAIECSPFLVRAGTSATGISEAATSAATTLEPGARLRPDRDSLDSHPRSGAVMGSGRSELESPYIHESGRNLGIAPAAQSAVLNFGCVSPERADEERYGR